MDETKKPIEMGANFGYQCDLETLNELYTFVRQICIVCELPTISFADFLGALCVIKSHELKGEL